MRHCNDIWLDFDLRCLSNQQQTRSTKQTNSTTGICCWWRWFWWWLQRHCSTTLASLHSIVDPGCSDHNRILVLPALGNSDFCHVSLDFGQTFYCIFPCYTYFLVGNIVLIQHFLVDQKYPKCYTVFTVNKRSNKWIGSTAVTAMQT